MLRRLMEVGTRIVQLALRANGKTDVDEIVDRAWTILDEAKVEYLLSRNSQNSSSPPSKDDDPGRTGPEPKPERGKAEPNKRAKGKQPGSRGMNLA